MGLRLKMVPEVLLARWLQPVQSAQLVPPALRAQLLQWVLPVLLVQEGQPGQ